MAAIQRVTRPLQSPSETTKPDKSNQKKSSHLEAAAFSQSKLKPGHLHLKLKTPSKPSAALSPEKFATTAAPSESKRTWAATIATSLAFLATLPTAAAKTLADGKHGLNQTVSATDNSGSWCWQASYSIQSDCHKDICEEILGLILADTAGAYSFCWNVTNGDNSTCQAIAQAGCKAAVKSYNDNIFPYSGCYELPGDTCNTFTGGANSSYTPLAFISLGLPALLLLPDFLVATRITVGKWFG
jgi:hypothetical protein